MAFVPTRLADVAPLHQTPSRGEPPVLVLPLTFPVRHLSDLATMKIFPSPNVQDPKMGFGFVKIVRAKLTSIGKNTMSSYY